MFGTLFSLLTITPEDKALLEGYFAEMRHLNELMRRDQIEIDRLSRKSKEWNTEIEQMRQSTQAALLELKEIISKLQKRDT